jgi:hypothetical protein
MGKKRKRDLRKRIWFSSMNVGNVEFDLEKKRTKEK